VTPVGHQIQESLTSHFFWRRANAENSSFSASQRECSSVLTKMLADRVGLAFEQTHSSRLCSFLGCLCVSGCYKFFNPLNQFFMDAVICKQVQVREWEAMNRIQEFKWTATRPSVAVLEDLITLSALLFPKHRRVGASRFPYNSSERASKLVEGCRRATVCLPSNSTLRRSFQSLKIAGFMKLVDA
jgi:hypothetical protein